MQFNSISQTFVALVCANYCVADITKMYMNPLVGGPLNLLGKIDMQK